MSFDIAFLMLAIFIIFMIFMIFMIFSVTDTDIDNSNERFDLIEKQKKENEGLRELVDDLLIQLNILDRYRYYNELNKIESKTKKGKISAFKNKRVLIGEGDFYHAISLKKVLEDLGIEVVCVRTGKEVLENINKNVHYDLIITADDYRFGTTTAREISRSVEKIIPDSQKEKGMHKIFREIPVVIALSNESESIPPDIWYDDFVFKPLTQEKVIGVLKKHFKS